MDVAVLALCIVRCKTTLILKKVAYVQLAWIIGIINTPLPNSYDHAY